MLHINDLTYRIQGRTLLVGTIFFPFSQSQYFAMLS